MSRVTTAFAGKWPTLIYLIDDKCDAVSQKIPLVTGSSYFVTSDLCKVAEQWGDVIGQNDLIALTYQRTAFKEWIGGSNASAA